MVSPTGVVHVIIFAMALSEIMRALLVLLFQIVFLVLYSVISVPDVIYLIIFTVDRKLRSEPREWLPVAMVICVLISNIVFLTHSVGQDTNATSWNNFMWLCKIIYPIFLATLLAVDVLFCAIICVRIVGHITNMELTKLIALIIFAGCMLATLVWEFVQVYGLTRGLYMQHHICVAPSESSIFDMIAHVVALSVLLLLCIVGAIFYFKDAGGTKPLNAGGDLVMSPRSLLGSALIVGFVYLSMRIVQFTLIGISNLLGYHHIAAIIAAEIMGIIAMTIVPTLWIAIHIPYRETFKKIFLPCLSSHANPEKAKLLA